MVPEEKLGKFCEKGNLQHQVLLNKYMYQHSKISSVLEWERNKRKVLTTYYTINVG